MTIKLMKGINCLVLFALLNCLWLVGIIIGLFFGGLVPATYALICLYKENELFEIGISYQQIIKRFFRLWLAGIKKFHFTILLLSGSIFLVYWDILVVQQNQMMKALFLWPLFLMLSYIVLAVIQLSYAGVISNAGLKAKIKLALTAPLLLPLESILSMVVFGSFFILGLRFNGFFLIFGAVVIFIIFKMLQHGYEKKGLVIHE